MDDSSKAVVWSLLLAVVVAVIAVFAYNQIIVKPQMAELNKQIVQLTQTTNHNAAVLDKHAEVIERLSGTVDQNAKATEALSGTVSQNAQATNSLTDTVNNNASVANQNASTANYNASMQPSY